MVDVAIVNAWLIYRRYCKPLGLQLNKQKSLAEFTAEFAQSLIHAHKTQGEKSNKGRLKRKSYEPLQKTGKKKAIPQPNQEIHCDQIEYRPQPKSEKKRCRNCPN